MIKSIYNYFVLKNQIEKLQAQMDKIEADGSKESSLLYFEIMMDLLVLEKDHYRNQFILRLNLTIIVLIGIFLLYHFGILTYLWSII